jgi:MerR family redox-sensitive transcriptional activator SoxR
MAQLSISEVVRQVGVAASAIRYYEQIGILRPAPRVSGQRRYDSAAVHRLAVLRRAQEAGFTLEEIRNLLLGFRESVPLSARWKALAARKMIELDARMAQIRAMKELLQNLESRCGCDTIDECGARFLHRGFQNARGRPPRPTR